MCGRVDDALLPILIMFLLLAAVFYRKRRVFRVLRMMSMFLTRLSRRLSWLALACARPFTRTEIVWPQESISATRCWPSKRRFLVATRGELLPDRLVRTSESSCAIAHHRRAAKRKPVRVLARLHADRCATCGAELHLLDGPPTASAVPVLHRRSSARGLRLDAEHASLEIEGLTRSDLLRTKARLRSQSRHAQLTASVLLWEGKLYSCFGGGDVYGQEPVHRADERSLTITPTGAYLHLTRWERICGPSTRGDA